MMTTTVSLELTLDQLGRLRMWQAAYSAMANMTPEAEAKNDTLLNLIYDAENELEEGS